MEYWQVPYGTPHAGSVLHTQNSEAEQWRPQQAVWEGLETTWWLSSLKNLYQWKKVLADAQKNIQIRRATVSVLCFKLPLVPEIDRRYPPVNADGGLMNFPSDIN